MIYLIKTDYIDGTLLKIGYTEDKNKEKRFSSYKMHNPKSVVLFTIPGGTEKHEKAIHHKFHPFLYSNYGNEWFNFDQTIIDFFTTHTTKDSLDNEFAGKEKVSIKAIPELHKEINFIVNRWLCIDSDTPERLQQNYSRIKRVILDCREAIKCDEILKKEDILPYLIKKYNISSEQERKIRESNPRNIDFFTDFYNAEDFTEKMRLVCTYDDMTDEILDFIPLTYKVYYKILGPDRCYAQGYNKTYLEREYKDTLFDKSQLRDEIYNIFEVGKRYIRSEVKETLKNLYTSLGYNKIPKANDLEKYFEIRSCQITNKETGKKDHSFEIIKRKENFDDLFD